MTEVIEGHAVEIVPAPEIRAVAVVQQPGQVIVSDDATDMVAVASRLATVLADIVERQRLFAVIQGKKYPTVEAWMTIARLDNVVAREPRPPIRHDDGSYEAFAELIRLSDGMPIGSASALCGTPDDKPWAGRTEPNRRSMAQTRATSRAFRQQYSWIMALAGYEPTPADEMPEAPVRAITADTAVAAPRHGAVTTWSGAFVTTDSADANLRAENERGHILKFVIADVEPRAMGKRRLNVRVFGPLAVAVNLALSTHGNPKEIVVEGEATKESFEKDGRMIAYAVCEATRVSTADWTVPAPGAAPIAPEPTSVEKVEDLSELPW